MEKVPPASMEDNLVSTNVTLELKKDKITGHVVRRFVGESKNFFLNLYNGIPADMRKKLITRLLEMEGSNTEASKIETSDFSNRDIPIELKGDIEITNTVTSADNLIYTHIDFFPSAILNFIPDEERQTPFDLGRVFISIDEITLELPPGTGVKKLPEAFNFTFQENTIQANYHYENNKVVLLKKLELNSPVIYPQDFAKWKGFLTQIKTYNRNSITLVKE